MKQIKKYIITNFIILILKVIGGLFLHSNTLLASSIIELVLIINSILTISKENKIYKNVISILYALSIIIGLVFLNYYSIINENNNPSLLIIIILIVCLFARYVVSVLGINKTNQKKNGIIAFSNISSNQEFIIFLITLISIIINKIGKWIDILHYADKVGCLIISVLLLVKTIKIISNTFIKPKEFITEYTNEITSHKEIKNIKDFKLSSFGGIRKISINIIPKDNISMIDFSSFIVNLEDYLLKKADVAIIGYGEENSFRKVMENARNCGSRNSKANSNKKNTKKKNKKR